MVSKKQHGAEPRREHKDRLFTYLFSQPDHQDWMISLINALSGSHYSQDEPIQVMFIGPVCRKFRHRSFMSYITVNVKQKTVSCCGFQMPILPAMNRSGVNLNGRQPC